MIVLEFCSKHVKVLPDEFLLSTQTDLIECGFFRISNSIVRYSQDDGYNIRWAVEGDSDSLMLLKLKSKFSIKVL